MKTKMMVLGTAALTGSLVWLTPVCAQTSAPLNSSQADAMSSRNDPGGPGAANELSSGGKHQAAAEKIRQNLQNAGFTNIKVVAESYVVQANSPDGNPVLMTIGPQGMSVFEALNTANTGGTGAGAGQTSGSTAGQSGSAATGQSSGVTVGQSGSAAAGQSQPMESEKMGGGNAASGNDDSINSTTSGR